MENNISRRRSSDANNASCSVYLSFDAESTMSTACYRTLEAMTEDTSVLASLSTLEEAFQNTEEKHTNSTLENVEDSSLALSPVKTVKKMEVMTTNTPLRALPKNILREYKALCSTPSKEQLLKSVDVTRGSDVSRCDDLGVAFLGVEDGLPAFFPPPPPHQQQRQNIIRSEENKENVSDGSTLSVSSSVEITSSVIERKCLTSISTTGSLASEDTLEERNQVEFMEIVVTTDDKTDKKKTIHDIDEFTKDEENTEITSKLKSILGLASEMKDKIKSVSEAMDTHYPDNVENVLHHFVRDEVDTTPKPLNSGHFVGISKLIKFIR